MTDRPKTLNRRQFISKTLAGAGAAAAVSGLARPSDALARTAGPSVPAAPAAAKPLVTRALGKTGYTLPVVNMGVMNADNPDLVRRAFELGMRHFDTAAGYWRGKNEEMVGKVIGDLKARDQVVIATKVAIPPERRRSFSAAELKSAFIKVFEGSLRRLNMDYVDMLYIHDVSDAEDLKRPGFMEALSELKAQKKTRFVGFSCHENMAACLDEAVRSNFYEVVLVAFNYALAGNTALTRSLEAASAKGIGLVAMKTQCMQSWYRDMVPSDQQALYGGSIVQTAVLKWVLRHNFIHCAVPGFTNFKELEEDIAAGRDLEYTPEEKKFLEDRKIKLAMAHCVQCGACRGTCPRGADTTVLMRAHMYLRYPNVGQARDTLAALGPAKGLAKCASCDTCSAVCSGRVDIARRIEQLKIHFG